LFDLRWYQFPSPSEFHDQESSLPGIFAGLDILSSAATQCDTIISSVLQIAAAKDTDILPGKATVVRLIFSLLKTISFYCKVCMNCILRDKAEHEMIMEYCKRV